MHGTKPQLKLTMHSFNSSHSFPLNYESIILFPYICGASQLLVECLRTSNKQERYTTALSHAVWEAIDKKDDPRIEWSVLANSCVYHTDAPGCNLCHDEKLAILLEDPSFILDKRTELSSKRCHKNKFFVIFPGCYWGFWCLS